MPDLSEGKQLLNAGLNTVAMVAFSIPGGAPLGVAMLVFMTVFDAILGEPPPPPNLSMTRGELKNAMDAVKAQIIDAIWKGQEDDITDQVLALHQGFVEVYAAMSKLKMDGERYVLGVTNDTLSNFIANTDAYFDMTKAVKPTGILYTLWSARNLLELRSLDKSVILSEAQKTQHKTATLGIYGLIGSLTCSYLKTAVLWQWGRELLIAWQYQQYLIALDTWNQMTPFNQGNNPAKNPVNMYPGVDTAPTYKAPTWNEWKDPQQSLGGSGTNPAKMLTQEVQDLLSYCVGTTSQPGIYPTILNTLTDLDTKLSAGSAGLVFGSAVTKAQMINAVEQGAKGAGWLEVRSPANGFDKVSEDDILAFGATIDAWRSASASVSFHTHPPVAGGETLTSIAQGEYPGEDAAAFAQKLYDTNPAIKFVTPPPPNGNSLGIGIVQGTIVKIFDKDAFAYLGGS